MVGAGLGGPPLVSLSDGCRPEEVEALDIPPPVSCRLAGWVVVAVVRVRPAPCCPPQALDIPPAVSCRFAGWVAVEAGHQRQGIGTSLVRTVEDLLVEDGIRTIVADTPQQNLPARNFLEVGLWCCCWCWWWP